MSDESEFRRQLFLQFPVARVLDAALSSEAHRQPIFFTKQITSGDLEGSRFALLRLGKELERQFNINGEVAALFLPYKEFQRRAYNFAATGLMPLIRNDLKGTEGSERYTPDQRLTLVWASDPELVARCSSWNTEGQGSLLVPIGSATEPDTLRIGLEEQLSSVLGSRDLYSGKSPVQGADFFGRGELLSQLEAAMLGDQNIALFGLRRSGKTSVLLEAQRRLARRSVLISITSLESIVSVREVARLVSESVNQQLRSMQVATSSIWIGNTKERDATSYTFADLGVRLQRVAEKNQGIRIVVALDEIESLDAFAEREPEQVRALFGALRSAANARGNLSLFFTGVTSRIFQNSLLNGRVENPLFGYVDEYYLRPFIASETRKLLVSLGRQMQLTWDTSAIDLAHLKSGGFPYFSRAIASKARAAVRSDWQASGAPYNITARVVGEVLPDWSRIAHIEWAQIVSSMEAHYPGAAEILGAESSSDLHDWINLSPELNQTAMAIEALGLLERQGEEYEPTAGLAALRLLSPTAPTTPTRSQLGTITLDIFRDLAGKAESHTLEFKLSARIDTKTGKKEAYIERAIVKSVAGFLNADGGTLLVGVSDGGAIVGLQEDIRVTRDADRFEAWLIGDLLAGRLGETVVAQNVRFTMLDCAGARVAAIAVETASVPIWAAFSDGECLWVRSGNQTRELRGSEIATFCSSRTAQV